MAKRQTELSKKEYYNEVVFDGETYHVAPIGKGYDISKEDKIQIAKLACLMYSTDKYTFRDCLLHCGVRSEGTWFKWLNEIEEIESLFKLATAQKASVYRVNLKERALTMAEKLIEGYTIELTETEGIPITNPATGKIEGIETVRIRKKETFIRPVPAIILNILYNTDAHNFQASVKQEEQLSKEISIPLIRWVKSDEEPEE